MTKNDSRKRDSRARQQSPWALPMIGLVVLAFIMVILLIKRQSDGEANPATPSQPAQTSQQTATSPPDTGPVPPPSTKTAPASGNTMEVNKAVMVTAELDFGAKGATIAQALGEIDRRYEPADHLGRTFAILDAYGEPTADGKLHLSMHVSSEKPGRGSLVFKPTGQVLWDSAITPVPGASPAKNLSVYIGDDAGASWIVDGSSGAKSVLDAKLRDKNMAVRDFWPDGAEREVTLVYSACGCPVKVMARRAGERTERTKELPVIFPDDPAAVQTIAALMRW